MSDANKNQPQFEIQTSAGTVAVDADNEDAARLMARELQGGSILSVKQIGGKKEKASAANVAADAKADDSGK